MVDTNKKHERKLAKGLAKVLIAFILIIVGIFVAMRFVQTKPKVPRRGGALSESVLVKARQLKPQNYKIIVESMGTVVADNEVVLKPRITGEIISLAPQCTAGGYFKAGEKILQIDPRDYEIELRESKTQVVEKTKELKIEMGMQEVSKREFEILKEEGYEFAEDDSELVLRQPQLKAIKAQLEAAKAKVEKAELNVKRTEIKAPFNGQILSGCVDLGSLVSPQTDLVTFVGTDLYKINATIPVSDLQWIDIPDVKSNEKGPEIKIFNKTAWGAKAFRKGYIRKLTPSLETKGRLARISAKVPDPLTLSDKNKGKPTLLIGMYVMVKIEGKQLENVYVIPRRALHDGSFIWIADKEDKLRIKKVDPLRRDREIVIIKDEIQPGDRLIVSDLAAPVEGIKLRFEQNGPETQPETAPTTVPTTTPEITPTAAPAASPEKDGQ